MPSQIELLNAEPVDYDGAINKTYNVVNRHRQLQSKNAFGAELWRQRDSIAAIARHHLGLRTQDTVSVYPQDKWLEGGFNFCVPIEVNSEEPEEQPEATKQKKKVLLKCPMPFRVTEGGVEEKLRSETGAYVWMQTHCPGIRIPYLYGFGTPTHQFTHISAQPWYRRLWYMIRRWFTREVSEVIHSKYTSHPVPASFSSHYMLLEFIGPETGHILYRDWPENMIDFEHRTRLLTGISNIMLQMARVPASRIGSFCFNNDGSVTLTNRPMFAATAILENQGTSRAAPEGYTYSCTDQFVSDTINFMDEHFLAERSISNTEDDCRGQMATGIFLRAVAHKYIRKEFRNGPFLVQLTDLTGGNFFVDDDWNISCLFDLEWVCALPVEHLSMPYWLGGHSIDGFTGDNHNDFWPTWNNFMHNFQKEYLKLDLAWPLVSIMDRLGRDAGFWFWSSLGSVDGAFWLVLQHIGPSFDLEMTADVNKIFAKLWQQKSDDVVGVKLEEFKQYEEELKTLFEEPA